MCGCPTVLFLFEQTTYREMFTSNICLIQSRIDAPQIFNGISGTVIELIFIEGRKNMNITPSSLAGKSWTYRTTTEVKLYYPDVRILFFCLTFRYFRCTNYSLFHCVNRNHFFFEHWYALVVCISCIMGVCNGTLCNQVHSIKTGLLNGYLHPFCVLRTSHSIVL